MNDVTQIRVGGQMVGLVGLKAALAEAVDQCRGMTDAQVAQILLERLAKRNYIPKAVFYLAGLGGQLSGFVQSTRDVPKMLAIGGCQVGCAKAILEQAPVPVNYY
jgi:uncharacterized metal-binding protein